MAGAIPAKRNLPRPKTKGRSTVPRLKNETAYRNCKFITKKLLKNPSLENWKKFKDSYEKLLGMNPTMAKFFMNQVAQKLPLDKRDKFEEAY